MQRVLIAATLWLLCTNASALVNSQQSQQRPSDSRGRVYVSTSALNFNNATNTMVYTLTGGATLYVTDMLITGFNNNTSQRGLLSIQDGNKIVSQIVFPTAGIGVQNPAPQIVGMAAMAVEPEVFNSNVNVVRSSGTVIFSISIRGYKE